MGFPISFPWTLPNDAPLPYTPPVDTFGSLTYVSTHVADGLAMLLQQFKERPKLAGLVSSYLRQVQDLEAALWQILLSLDLDRCENSQLDGMGLLVGEPRRSRADSPYRAAIRVRILVNRSNGRHSEMLRILTLYLGVADGAGIVELREPAAAALTLNVYTVPESTRDLRVLARTIKPGGVNLDGRVVTSATRPYLFGWSGGAVPGVDGMTNGDSWSDDPSVGGLHAARI